MSGAALGRVRLFVRRPLIPSLNRLAEVWAMSNTDAMNHCIDLGVWFQNQIDAGRRIVSLEADGSIAEEIQ